MSASNLRRALVTGAWVFFGTSTMFQPSLYGQEIIHQVVGEGSIGSASARCGDVNGDGLEDLIVGAPGYWQGTERIGYARLVSGKDGSTLRTYLGLVHGGCFGDAVDGAGDVDADGFVDAIIGAQAESWPQFHGRVRVFSGSTGAILHTFVGEADYTSLGQSVSRAGDIDADGHDDVLAGGFGPIVSLVSVGTAVLYSGKTGTSVLKYQGSSPSNVGVGFSVAGGSDLDGDGMPDFAITSALAQNQFGIKSGVVRVFSGADASLLHALEGTESVNYLGRDAAFVSDLDGDNVDDLVLGVNYVGGQPVGGAVVFSGKTGTRLYDVDGAHPLSEFGHEVCGLEDLDGDGLADFAVSGYSADSNGVDAGLVRVYSGKDGDLLFSISGTGQQQVLGRSISGISDLDGDGIGELIVGIPGSGPGLLGTVGIYSGRCQFLQSYGTGCPGSGGITPILSSDTGCVAVGQSATIRLDDGLGSSTAFLLMGLSPANLPLSPTCSLLVDSLLPAIPQLLLPGVGAGNGDLSFTVTIPSVPGGWSLYAQAFLADPAAPLGFSATNGLKAYYVP